MMFMLMAYQTYDELYEIDKVCVTGACYRENIDALLMKHGGGLTFTYSDELDVGWSVGEKGDLPLTEYRLINCSIEVCEDWQEEKEEFDLALAFIIGISVFVCLVLSVTVVKRYNKWKVNHSKTVE